jgi:multisubunit Na+/H+ antiporter MnhE subunit
MTDIVMRPADLPVKTLANGPATLTGLNTTVGSGVHSWLGPWENPDVESIPFFRLYVAAVVLTFVPLALGAALSPLSLVTADGALRLPFLYDWNVAFMFLVSFPCVLMLTVTDQRMLARAIKNMKTDGTITISETDESTLTARWNDFFRKTNPAGQIAGVLVGAVVAYFNYRAYVPAEVGFWIAKNDHLLPVGYVFLYCIFLFYALTTLYVFRSIAISLMLRDVVAHAQLHMLPLHPDRCGGLLPVGRLGLRNQYVLSLFGLNIVLLVTVSLHYLDVQESLNGLIAAAVIAYLVLGPIVFMAPLLPFRSGMLKNKNELMSEVAQRLRTELDRLRGQLPSGSITKDDEDLIERLRKIGAVIEGLPVWPFDASTLRRFVTAYIVPVASGVGIPAAKAFVGWMKLPLLGG